MDTQEPIQEPMSAYETAEFPDEYMDLVPLTVGGVTFWHGRGTFGEPFFRVHMNVDAPSWYPLVVYTVRENRDGDGWFVQLEHQSTIRPFNWPAHPFLRGLLLPDLLAAVAVMVRARVNLFRQMSRPGFAPQQFDWSVLTVQREKVVPEVMLALAELPDGR